MLHSVLWTEACHIVRSAVVKRLDLLDEVQLLLKSNFLLVNEYNDGRYGRNINVVHELL